MVGRRPRLSVTFLDAMATSAILVAGLAIDRQNKLLTSDNMEDSYLAAGVFPAGVAWTTGSSPLACDTHFLICGVLTRLSWTVTPQTRWKPQTSWVVMALSDLDDHPNAWQEVEEPLLEHLLGRQHHVLGHQTPAGSSLSCAGSATPAGLSTISGSSFAAESCPPADSSPAETTRQPSPSRELPTRQPAGPGGTGSSHCEADPSREAEPCDQEYCTHRRSVTWFRHLALLTGSERLFTQVRIKDVLCQM